MGRRRHRRNHRRESIERAAERRAIHKLNDWDTPIDENEASIINTQLKCRSERRSTRGTNVANTIVGVGKIATGVVMGFSVLDFERTGSITSSFGRGIVSGISKLTHH